MNENTAVSVLFIEDGSNEAFVQRRAVSIESVGTTAAVARPPYMPETSVLMDYRR
jgi:hypothetical protein